MVDAVAGPGIAPAVNKQAATHVATTVFHAGQEAVAKTHEAFQQAHDDAARRGDGAAMAISGFVLDVYDADKTALDAGRAAVQGDVPGALAKERELEGRITMLAAVFVVPEDPEAAAGEIENLASELDQALKAGGCFVAGTPVLTRSGLRPIESLRTGDTVLARNEKTGQVSYRRVLRTIQHDDKQTLLITVRSSTGAEETLEATPNHRFWTTGSAWTRADGLSVGSHLINPQGAPLTVVAVAPGKAGTTVYNIEVDEFHSYYVGTSPVLVHNGGGECWRNLPSLDQTGKVHGELPMVEDLGKYSKDDLEQLQAELEQSVETRIQRTIELGSDPAHGQRQAAEQRLIRWISTHLGKI